MEMIARKIIVSLIVIMAIPSLESSHNSWAHETIGIHMNKEHSTFLKNYCLECHNEKKSKGKFRIDDLEMNVKHQVSAKKWQDILNALNGGEMPPEDEKQPKDTEKADFLEQLSDEMVLIRKTLSDQNGLITMRRLNRREYSNTLKDLLGAVINTSELPDDATTGSFDTDGSNLFMSSYQIEQYLALARIALDEAFAVHNSRNIAHYQRFEAEVLSTQYKTYVDKIIEDKKNADAWVEAFNLAAAKPENADILTELKRTAKNDASLRREWKKIIGAPAPEDYGFKTVENNADKANGALNPYYLDYYQSYLTQPNIDTGAYLTLPTLHPSLLPTGYLSNLINFKWTPGEYVVRVRAAAKDHGPRNRKFIEFGLDSRSGDVMNTFEVTAPMASPQVVEIPLKLTTSHNNTRENRELYLREKGTGYFFSSPRGTFNQLKKENGLGPEYLVWIDWIEIEKVPSKQPPPFPGIEALGIPLDDHQKEIGDETLHSALERFSIKAFRDKKPPEDYLKKLISIYKHKRDNGIKHMDALKDTLSVILASPMFLYISEKSSVNTTLTISDLELASRLSYFLWGGPPDQTLLDLAQSKKLSETPILNEQTLRLLNHDKAKFFIDAFTYQWLGLNRIDFFKPDIKKFTDFDNSVRLSIKQEVYETLHHLFKHNLSIQDLLKSDYVVINNVLAQYYGIDRVEGDHFRKVSIAKDSPRGGLLGMAATHLMGGNGTESSPVERGAWVLRKILNSPPPPAPANVPQLSRLSNQVLTTRERLLAHQEEPQCASCHRKIDPIGFGLENFDAVGQWREEDHYSVKGLGEKKWTINPAAAFYRGPAFNSYLDMREIIASKVDDFAEGFATALSEYGLGRPIGFSDKDLIENIVKQAKTKNYAIREFVLALVQSKEFKLK